MRGAQGKSAYRLNPIFPKPFHHTGKADLPIDEGNHQSLLMLMYPPGQGLFFRKLVRNIRVMTSGAELPVDLVGCFVKLGDGIERNNLAEFTYQEAKQFFWLPLRSDEL